MLHYASEKPENLKLAKRGVASAGMALLLIHFDPAISDVREGRGSMPWPWYDNGGS